MTPTAPPTPARKLTRAEWTKTPYAGTSVADSAGAIRGLLAKYGVTQVQVTECPGPDGRPYFEVRFRLKAVTYRVGYETLLADARPDDLFRQVQRAVYHTVKAALEAASVFAPAEKTLFAYAETVTGQTVFEAAAPALAAHRAPDFRAALPPAVT